MGNGGFGVYSVVVRGVHHQGLCRSEVEGAVSTLLHLEGLAVVGVGPPTCQQLAAGGQGDAVHPAVGRLHQCSKLQATLGLHTMATSLALFPLAVLHQLSGNLDPGRAHPLPPAWRCCAMTP